MVHCVYAKFPIPYATSVLEKDTAVEGENWTNNPPYLGNCAR